KGIAKFAYLPLFIEKILVIPLFYFLFSIFSIATEIFRIGTRGYDGSSFYLTHPLFFTPLLSLLNPVPLLGLLLIVS
ncbi:MAG: hypothetical protein JW932_03420, partial [Deltaproteobacteria bacterium]|nr:hypothetical protein [Deltaproteobacteria bacterium]